jgi:hypothetical protein
MLINIPKELIDG